MENAGRTLVCSVLFLDIAAYSKQSVADQTRLKQSFNAILSKALDAVAVRDRVILDTGDGAAIAFLGDPADALFVALAIRDGTELPVRMGVNLGPVRLVKDINGQTNMIGDGINVAQRVMGFSEPGQLLVSRSFFEVVSRLSDDYANLFTHEGLRADKHVREHEVYSVIIDASGQRSSALNQSDEFVTGEEGRGRPPLLGIGGGGVPNKEEAANVFDAGANLIISGYSRARVQEALDELVRLGAKVISQPTSVSDKWIACCEHPSAPVSACKVANLAGRQIVTGPTKEAVAAKVSDLVRLGAIPVGEITFIRDVWTAVCRPAGD